MLLVIVFLIVSAILIRAGDPIGIATLLILPTIVIAVPVAVLLAMLIFYYPFIGSMLLCASAILLIQSGLVALIPVVPGLISLLQLYQRRRNSPSSPES